MSIKAGYKWGGEEEDEVEEDADGYVEEEDGGVVYFRSVLLADESLRETAVDERLADGDEDGEHADKAVVVRGEDSRHEDHDDEADALD